MKVMTIEKGLRLSGFVVGESEKFFAFRTASGEDVAFPAVRQLQSLKGFYRKPVWITLDVRDKVEIGGGRVLWEVSVRASDPPRNVLGTLRRRKHKWTGRNVLENA